MHMLAQYKLVARLYDGKELVGYRLLDTSNNIMYDENISNVKILAHKKRIQGVILDKANRLRSNNGIYLSTYPKVKLFKNSISTFKTGDDLRDFCKIADNYKHRYCYSRLLEYLKQPTSKVFTLYGLRRTGKTIMLLQAAKEIGYKNCVYISLNNDDSSYELLRTLKEYVSRGIKYIFIDEITALNNMLNFIATLADGFTIAGVHIVISGTDSYMLKIASEGALYDRCILLNTTYVSFKEYNYLIGKTDIKDYIRYGGVLNRDDFYNQSKVHEYINTSISDNIKHSIEVSGRSKFGKIYDLINMGVLRHCIEATIQHTNEELSARILVENFVSKDIGSLRELLSKPDRMGLSSNLDMNSIEEQIKYYLHCSNLEHFSDSYNLMLEYYDIFAEMLNILNLTIYVRHYIDKKVSNNLLFVFPGLRYNQLKEGIIAFLDNAGFNEMNDKEQEFILSKLESDILGQMLEQVVLLELYNVFGFKRICKFNGIKAEEIDCVVKVNEEEIDLIEVKLSNKRDINQCKHLINNEFTDKIENRLGYRVRNRIVVYTGEDSVVTYNNKEIRYFNANSFLMNIKEYLNK